MRRLLHYLLGMTLISCPWTLASGQNFVGHDKELIDVAEQARLTSAQFWSGQPLPGDWSFPCPMTVRSASHSGGGTTQFRFENGEVHSWSMTIEGTRSALINDVIPHEVDHMVRASLVRHPIERWLDEGCATLFESSDSQSRLRRIAVKSDSTIITSAWLNASTYPTDPHELEALYAIGFSLTEFLLKQRGAATLLEFQAEKGIIEQRLQHHYDLSIESLRIQWDRYRKEQQFAVNGSSQTALRCLCGVTEQPLLVIWTSRWCPPCLSFKEVWEHNSQFKLLLKSHFHIHFIDVDQHPYLARQHGITTLPTFQTAQTRVVGFQTADELLTQLGINVAVPVNEIEKGKQPDDAMVDAPHSEPVPEASNPSDLSEANSNNVVIPEVAETSATATLSLWEKIRRGVPVGLTLLQWSGIIGSSIATGGLAGVAITLIPRLLKHRQQRRFNPPHQDEGGPAIVSAPFPRELDEARQLLAIRQSEGRVAVLDALRGMFLEDEITKLKASSKSQDESMLDDLLNMIDQRVEEVAPLTTKTSS